MATLTRENATLNKYTPGEKRYYTVLTKFYHKYLLKK